MVHLPSTPSHKKTGVRRDGEPWKRDFLYTSLKFLNTTGTTVGVLPHRRGIVRRATCSVNIALLRRQYEKPINVSADRGVQPRDCKTEVRLSHVRCVQRVRGTPPVDLRTTQPSNEQ